MEILVGVLIATVAGLTTLLAWSMRSRGARGTTVATERALVGQELGQVKEALERVTAALNSADRERAVSFATLGTQLEQMGKQTTALTETTQGLRQVLSNARTRGQWGERMAEDILRAIGFVEGINYQRQATIEGVGTRPDFVFLLPDGRRMNMDVKFPLDNYVRYLDSESDIDRDAHKKSFLHDVRERVKEVAGREYIDPAGGTVDYVLLFIPNESVYAFIHEADAGLLDTALKSKVVCCSPMTLFAVLALVREAVNSFALQQASEEIVALMGRFYGQWDKFSESMDTLGRRMVSAQTAFEDMSGRRKRALERPLGAIERLRTQRGIEAAPADDDEDAVLELTAGPMSLGGEDDDDPGEREA